MDGLHNKRMYMELTPFKCWDNKKHRWDVQHASFPYWHAWCPKCGSMAVFSKKLALVGKLEIKKNSKGDYIFRPPDFFKQPTQ